MSDIVKVDWDKSYYCKYWRTIKIYKKDLS